LSTFFRALAFLVAVCCLTWVGVLWWWQRTGHSAEVSDLVLYLGLLPLVLALLLLGLRWMWLRVAAARAATPGAAAAGAAGTTGTPVSASASGAEAEQRHAVVQLVLASVRCVAGDQAGDLVEAAAAGKPIPQPDTELTNDDGLPVLCARMPEMVLGLDAAKADLEQVLAAVRPLVDGAAHTEPDEHVWRALAALRPVLETQRDWLLALHQNRLAALDDGCASLERLPVSQRPPLPGVRVLLGCPAHWSVLEQALLKAWAEQCLDSHSTRLSTGYAVSLSVLADSGEALWLRADQASHGAARSPWLLVAACDSDLSPTRVEALLASNHLYDATQRPGGCMPGEAAAAVLLAPADWTPPQDMDLATVRLHRPVLLRRDKPVEAAGRVAHREVADALNQALAAARIEAAQLGLLVSDADQHSNRGAELYGMAVDALHHLDPVEDMRLLGRVTGRTGAASPLLLLAAAAEAARSAKKPTLALAQGDTQLRMALVLQPPAEGEPGTA
jgi:hypothetical protein